MRRLLFAVLSFLPVALFGQSTVKGVVIDSLTQEPMASATVYVNGTTLGTATDADGRFELKGVTFPAKVVFSFVGYQPQALDLTRNPGDLTIRLKTNEELPEIVVSGKENKVKKEDLDYFKSMFLGNDRWGRSARIKNENVLMFDRSFETSYEIRRIGRTTYASATAQHEAGKKVERSYDTVKVVSSVFTAWAYEPLIIDMPLLGYELYVDMVNFSVIKTNAVVTCDMLGYFYYRPYENLNKRKTQNIEENRKRAYYSSNQQFLRSLYNGGLTENGYMLSLTDNVRKGRKILSIEKAVDMRDYFADADNDMKQIHGLKDKKLRIRYYHRSDGSPMNLREKGNGVRHYSESWMTVLKDTCIFSKNGIVTDNSIQFTGELSKKRVGSCLPDDYCPSVDSATIVTDDADYASDLMKFAENINRFNSLFPQEKVYMEFDNTAYFQGENIWFKAFVTQASTLERAPSGVLYVDFVAPTGQIILQQKLKIEAGQADGAIPLLDAGTYQTREKVGILAYPSGFYEIRAYTQNMLDFSPEAVFSRVIPIYTQPKFVGEYDRSHVESNQDNPLVEKLRGKPEEKYNEEVNLKCYPEGGDIVKGLPCRVAFKATGKDGFGVDGFVCLTNTGDTAHTVHDGMGSFIIIPTFNNTVSFLSSDGKSGYCYLNTVSSGYSMMADMSPDSRMNVSIWRTADRIGERTALAVMCRGEVIYFKEIKDVENSQLEIDCSDWPVGVCRVTLFNTDGMILSSRSIFHYGKEYSTPTIAVNTDSMSRQSCDKEVMEFTLTDQDGNPFRDRFCLSVRDATDYGGGRTDNLRTNLLLSSDLKGYIHDPAWYLESYDDEHREALNLLTLVQGWERYEWKYMTGLEKFEEKHRIEEGLTMNGWILSYGRRNPVSDIGVYASLIPKEDRLKFETFENHTDSTGYFGFNLSDFYGNGNFTVNLMSVRRKGDSKHEKSKRIRFERADRPDPRPYMIQETDLDHNDHRIYDYKVDYSDNDLTAEQRRKLGRMIDDVDIEEQSGKRRFIDYDTFTSFDAEKDTEYELDMGEVTTDVFGYFLAMGIRLEEEIPSLIEGEKSNEVVIEPKYYVHNNERVLTHKPFDIPSQIDMIYVKSILLYDKPMTLRQIAELTPLKERYMEGHLDLEESWDIATSEKRYYLVDIQIKEDRELLFYWEIRDLGRRTTTVKGYTKPVQFYSQEYPDGPIEGSPDYRRTLYWNPNVITDENGRARVEFYNNSFTRKFTINAAGITASGVPYVLDQNW